MAAAQVLLPLLAPWGWPLLLWDTSAPGPWPLLGASGTGPSSMTAELPLISVST